MAKKIKNDYFKMIEDQVAFCVEASEMLAAMMADYTPENILTKKEGIHNIEHKADELHHDILAKLSAEFITPIDQEDILRLVQIIDDITDALDEVVLEFYMFHVTAAPAYAAKLAEVVNRCIGALYAAAKEFKNFKKPDALRSLLVDVNHIESEADEVFTEAIHELFGSDVDCKTLIGSKAIYESLEECCDLCEHASDVIEQIIIKNT